MTWIPDSQVTDVETTQIDNVYYAVYKINDNDKVILSPGKSKKVHQYLWLSLKNIRTSNTQVQ